MGRGASSTSIPVCHLLHSIRRFGDSSATATATVATATTTGIATTTASTLLSATNIVRFTHILRLTLIITTATLVQLPIAIISRFSSTWFVARSISARGAVSGDVDNDAITSAGHLARFPAFSNGEVGPRRRRKSPTQMEFFQRREPVCRKNDFTSPSTTISSHLAFLSHATAAAVLRTHADIVIRQTMDGAASVRAGETGVRETTTVSGVERRRNGAVGRVYGGGGGVAEAVADVRSAGSAENAVETTTTRVGGGRRRRMRRQRRKAR